MTEFQFSKKKKEQRTSSSTGKLTKANFRTRGSLPKTQNGPASARSLHREVRQEETATSDIQERGIHPLETFKVQETGATTSLIR